MKVELTYEVVVTIDDQKVKSSDLERALQVVAEKFGNDVNVNETDATELDDEDEDA